MDGWIKLHRQLIEWEWYTEVNTFRLFMHLLLSANHKDKNWRGFDVKKGQVLSGRKSLSQETGLSERNVRTALKNLEKTNEVTIKTTKHFSIITITKWEMYQASDQLNDQQVTNDRPTSDQQVTTNNNDNNVRSNNINNTREDHFVQKTTISHSWIPDNEAQEYCRELGLDFNRTYQRFLHHYAGSGQTNHNWNYKFKSWCDEAYDRAKEKKKNEKEDDVLRGVRWKK